MGSCVFCQISAQSRTFHIGLKAEFCSYTLEEVKKEYFYSLNPYHVEVKEETSEKNYISLVPSFHIIASLDLSESISINLQPGLLFKPYWAFELGFYLIYKIPIPNIFVKGGLNMDFVNGEGGNSVTYSKKIPFWVLGLGYQLTHNISVDIGFYGAQNGSYGHWIEALSASGTLKLLHMVKVGSTITL